MGRPGKYIFLPRNSSIWHIRFQYPATDGDSRGSKKEWSLRTRDKSIAIEKSLPHIREHLIYLRELREADNPEAEKRPVVAVRRKYAPGKHVLDDGTFIMATEEKYMYSTADGQVREEVNQVEIVFPGPGITRAEYEARLVSDTLYEEDEETGEEIEVDCPDWRDQPVLRPKLGNERHDPDMVFLENWVKHQRVTKHIEREARITYELFKRITNNKRFEKAGYDDGKKLVDELFAAGNKWPTVRKKVGHLRAIVNVAVKHQKFRGMNPFAHVMPKKRHGDIKKRLGLDDEDMALVRQVGPKFFSEREWLLWVLLATTGMRISEAVSIDREYIEGGIRYIKIEDGKTESSIRSVPLPDAVLTLLPARIRGPLFPGETAAMLSKRMNRRLNAIGIEDERKVIHSLRHRAKTKLRARPEIKTKFELMLLGHERKTVADKYGDRAPMAILKPMIETIGC